MPVNLSLVKLGQALLMPEKKRLVISLVICTYKRAKSLQNLLLSVREQSFLPAEILIIDGSSDDQTKQMILKDFGEEVTYFQVNPEQRGLTRQRNVGISKVSASADVVAFLDDDTILTSSYFQVMADTFLSNPEVGGVGGIAINEDSWTKLPGNSKPNPISTYSFDGYFTPEPLRNKVRNILGLHSPLGSFQMGDFSHVRASGFPLTGKFYEVDLLIGMSFAFRKSITDKQKFSLFFDGYGLYEDADYSIRALRFGKNVIHTALQLYHYHHPSGRPNFYKYGKMVLRNGYYVWRLKYPNPSIKAKIKWHLTAGLLSIIRGLNFITGPDRIQAFQEFLGRVTGWWSLWFSKPKPSLD